LEQNPMSYRIHADFLVLSLSEGRSIGGFEVMENWIAIGIRG